MLCRRERKPKPIKITLSSRIYKKMVKKKSRAEVQVILAEERTVLSYIRTILSFIGIVFVIAKIYFEDITLYNPALLFIMTISLVILAEEILRVQKLRKKEK